MMSPSNNVSLQYDFVPETGTFNNSQHGTLYSHKSINNINYVNGEMTYPSHPEESSAPSFKVLRPINSSNVK